jgi:CheY-like chemotaxis protein
VQQAQLRRTLTALAAAGSGEHTGGLADWETPAAANVSQSAPTALTWRVLLAEDNAVNQRLAAKLLENLGCRVDVAANGREAFSMGQALPCDVIFMDCQMPEMDGYETTRAIQRDEPRRHTPVIALTANSMQGDRQACLRAGMDAYISKPIRPKKLAAVLARWVPAPAKA